ncbi:unnamed protein product [Brassicogethes aeneus]|uniref:Cuticle protein n=1 Tax=Brassicogethes aeneus TaxID=1431903 RepID=A0A9P0B9X3_BRAAE|nr:unnamed protein product [Brassicogethes aeneus]
MVLVTQNVVAKKLYENVTLIGLVSLSQAASPFVNQRYARAPAGQADYNPKSFEQVQSDSYELPPQLPLSLELPREGVATVPFFSPEPSTDLRAPVYEENQPDYYKSPIPSQSLVAPVETEWNPNHDPKFYFEVPALVTRQQLPTNQFPKKYNKELHTKEKPFSSKPKQEIILQAINEAEYITKQKNLHKTFDKLAKKENQRQIKVANDINKPSNNHNAEPVGAASNIQDQSGLSTDITSSLGIPFHSASSGERIDFHMVGHAGPYSYKWGFDTGKGHNRQFRFEERDNDGVVKGHYGFYDKTGKLQMVNYDAHPHKGFHAEGNFGNHDN